MSGFVYTLCALTSFVCFVLLLYHYRRQRGRLLFCGSVAFLCFALANVVLVVDLIVIPQVDLMFWRNLLNLLGVFILLFALIGSMGKDAQ